MAVARFQRGSVLLRGKRKPNWVGRWREDVINSEDKLVRINRKEVLGTKSDFPTKKLAMRELELRIAPINSISYRALRTATFAEFAEFWKNKALTQHSNAACGSEPTEEMAGPLLWELCHAGYRRTNDPDVCPTLLAGYDNCHNMVLTLRMMWHSAKAWGYVSHDPFEGLRFQRLRDRRGSSSRLDEIQRIIAAASGPFKSFCWLAAEPECGQENCVACESKTKTWGSASSMLSSRFGAARFKPRKRRTRFGQFAISPKLASHLRAYLSTWWPNLLNLVFATKNGTPWDQNLVVKRKLHPLLESPWGFDAVGFMLSDTPTEA